jgi:hypothetical protein
VVSIVGATLRADPHSGNAKWTTSGYRVFFGSCGAIALFFFLRYLTSSHPANAPATSMQAAQASANDSRILSGKLLTETNNAATAKMLATTTKKTGLLLRYRQAITTRNAGIIISAFIVIFAEPWKLVDDKPVIRRRALTPIRIANHIYAFNAELRTSSNSSAGLLTRLRTPRPTSICPAT